MKIVEKLKKGVLHVISEHAVSIGLYGLLTIIEVIFMGQSIGDNTVLSKILEYIQSILLTASISALLCESIHLYRKDRIEGTNTKKIIIFIVIMCSGILTSILNIAVDGSSFSYDFYSVASNGFFNRLYSSILVLYICLIIFFCYKRSKESFEMYVAKAFCGVMKAELVYAILAIGSILIIEIIDVLLFELWRYDVLERVELFLVGFVAYPCAIAGISDTDNEISRFGKAILSYVFVALLSIADVIIYIYIFKIIVTWTFPSNEVFGILTTLFAFGICIWTMAYGCAKGVFKKIAGLLPFFYAPFIILQIMCLGLRISQYGFTTSRYMGMMLIIFELIYMVLYAVRFCCQKDIVSHSLFVLSALVIVTLLVPIVNSRSIVLISQKTKIEKYLSGIDADETTISEAASAYNVIWDEGGEAGRKYLDSRLSKAQLEALNDQDEHLRSTRHNFNVNLHNYDITKIDTSSADTVYIIDQAMSDTEDHIDTAAINICDDSEEVLATLDIRSRVNAIIKKYKDGASNDELSKSLGHEYITIEGYSFIPTSLVISGTYDEEGKEETIITYVEIRGYLLK